MLGKIGMANEVEHNRSEIFVVVPSYNHAPFVEQCLRSIFDQTLHPKKLLVIDDGSTDSSPKIIEASLKNCPFDCEMIVRENRGLSFTLNQGFALSDGKYFAYLGSDDYWLPNLLAERCRLLEARTDAVLAYGHSLVVDESNKIVDCSVDHPSGWGNFTDGNALKMLLAASAPVSSSVVYRRSALDQVSWNESARLEDYEMYLSLSRLGSFAFDPQILSAWRRHSYNTSRDCEMMLSEVVKAQRRLASALGLSESALSSARDRSAFLYARNALASGAKLLAFRLALKHWRGANSPTDFAKFFLRLATPMFVVNAGRKIKRNGTSQRYGQFQAGFAVPDSFRK
ncbi:MAG TPA: glycosyltransferase family 2 protein [Pyrinomonadaceae bacterium]|nr:glycosyltransferase family 2 protein [Pyrinomonadaceae bacterium]